MRRWWNGIFALVIIAIAAWDAWARSYLAEHRIPGASLAIVRDGRTVYARGFGFADRDTGALVEPASVLDEQLRFVGAGTPRGREDHLAELRCRGEHAEHERESREIGGHGQPAFRLSCSM